MRKNSTYLIPKTPRFMHHHPHLRRDIRLPIDSELAPIPLAQVSIAVVGFPEEDWFLGGLSGFCKGDGVDWHRGVC